MSTIKNTDIKNFLNDFRKNSVTIILETAKEKNDLLAVAKAKGINLKDNRDLAGFKTIFAFTDKPNDNGAILVEKKLLKALPSMIGKPMDIDHDRRYVTGHYIDYRYIPDKKQIEAYGVFYKSNFGQEWQRAKKLFKAGKLTTSFEIWSNKKKRKYNADGTYELSHMEIAGGGLMFDEKPAFEDAKVLEFAKKTIEHSDMELIFASKENDTKDLILAEQVSEVIVEEKKDEQKEIQESEHVEEVQKKVKCINCDTELTQPDMGLTKCPNCFAMVDQVGQMIYPPQIINFNISCLECSSNSWLIKSKQETGAKLKCQSCSKEYDIKFKEEQSNDMLDEVTFLHSSYASCPQCSTGIPFMGSSRTEERNFTCKSCGLKFSDNIYKRDKKLTIASITEAVKTEIELSSERGGKDMSNEQKEELKVVKTDIEVVEETVVEAPKTEEVATEKSEEVIEVIEETVTDEVVEEVTETPKEETTEEEIPIDTQHEATFENEEVIDCASKDVIEAMKYTADDSEEVANLSDDMFAVVKSMDNKKIRIFPMHTSSHVEIALNRVKDKSVQENLKALNIDLAGVMVNLIAVDKENRYEKMEDTKMELASLKAELTNSKSLVKKAVSKIRELKKTNKLNKDFYREHSSLIMSRREELDENTNSKISDVDIINDGKFNEHKVEMVNASLETSSVVGSKTHANSDSGYADVRNAIEAKRLSMYQKKDNK